MASSFRFEIQVKSFGPNEALASRLIDQIIVWKAAGRPTEEQLHIKAYPHDGRYEPAPGEIVLQKQWTQLLVSWERP